MNRVETALMNNPVRRAVQRRVEVPLLRRLGGVMAGGRALELGCGQGYGLQLILDQFGADEVLGVDVDPHMLRLAGRRRAGCSPRIALCRASASELPVASSSVDAVFDFGILHHVEDWRAAVAQVARVLRCGGRFYFEEVTAQALARPSYRRFLQHPTEDRFSDTALVDELEACGLRVGGRRTGLVGGDFLVGVAERG